MGYNEAYLNLLSQQAARRAQHLRDVANIGAQAQMTSAEAWGRVPGTLAQIGAKFAGDAMNYSTQKRENEIKARTAAVAEGRLDLAERNAAEAARATAAREATAVQTEKDKANAEQAKIAADFLEKNKLSIADTLRAAAKGTNDYALRYDAIVGLADLYDQATFGKQQIRQKLVPPDKMTPEGLVGLESLAASIFAGVEKPKPILAGPGTDVLDANDPSKVLHTTPTKPNEPPKLGTLERYTIDKFGASASPEQQATARTEWEKLNDQIKAAGLGGSDGAWFPAGPPRLGEDGTWYLPAIDRKTSTVKEIPFSAGTRPKPTEGGIIKQNNSVSGLATLRIAESILASPEGITTILKAGIPGSPGARMYQTLRQELGDLLARLRTGAQINEQEMALYMGEFMPNAKDVILDNQAETQRVLEYKLGKFRALFSNLAKAGGMTDDQVKREVDKAYQSMTAKIGQSSLPPAVNGTRRVVGPNGQTGSVPTSTTTLPPGWSWEKK